MGSRFASETLGNWIIETNNNEHSCEKDFLDKAIAKT